MESDDDIDALNRGQNAEEVGNDGYDCYDPDQTIEEKRKITRTLRRLEDEIVENQETYKQPGNKDLLKYMVKLNDHYVDVKQPAEAALDAGNLVKVSEVQAKRLKQVTGGPLDSGVDPDELVSKCITFMRRGGGIADDDDDAEAALTHTQQHRRTAAAHRRRRGEDSDSDDEEEEGGGDMMNWSHLGRYACVPHVGRPALPGFLLGPLSVQKKVRRVVTRTAPLRVRDLQEVRPEVLKNEELVKKDEHDLTAICHKILRQLRRVQEEGHERVRVVHEDDNTGDNDVEEMQEKTGITDSGNVDLVRFCINPRSFGQTVENLFYVSFLIREGLVHVEYEENGLPSICECIIPFQPYRAFQTDGHV